MRGVTDRSASFVDEPATDPALLRTLAAAGLPATGRFLPKAGWVSRVWVGDEYRRTTEQRTVSRLVSPRGYSRQPARRQRGPTRPAPRPRRRPGRAVVRLRTPARPNPARGVAGGGLAHAPSNDREPRLCVARTAPGSCRGGPAAALAGRRARRQAAGCVPPTRGERGAPSGRGARRQPGHDARLLADVADWIQERLALFAADEPVLVHGDVHGSNVIVDARTRHRSCRLRGGVGPASGCRARHHPALVREGA